VEPAGEFVVLAQPEAPTPDVHDIAVIHEGVDHCSLIPLDLSKRGLAGMQYNVPVPGQFVE
jgi:hypothetical protein